MGTDEPMRSEEYAAGYAAGVASLRMIRCLEHREVPPFNASEIGGGECAACAVKVSQGHSLVLQTEANSLRASVEELTERHARLVKVARLHEEEGMALRADIRKQWRDDLRAALAAEEDER